MQNPWTTDSLHIQLYVIEPIYAQHKHKRTEYKYGQKEDRLTLAYTPFDKYRTTYVLNAFHILLLQHILV